MKVALYKASNLKYHKIVLVEKLEDLFKFYNRFVISTTDDEEVPYMAILYDDFIE